MSADGLKLLILTGMSGAGKGVALRCLEDLGYYCVDNMLPPLIPKFLDLARQSATPIRLVAFVVDIRERNYFRDIFGVLQYLAAEQVEYQIVYLDCRDDVLIRRYSETRRKHPLADGKKNVAQAVAAERELLEEIKGKANLILDTSDFPLPALREEIRRRFRPDGGGTGGLQINLLSFGFKHGLPAELDLLFDVRFLPNPYYISRFKDLDGLNPEVRDYVCKWPDAAAFLERLDTFLTQLLPLYQREGKAYLNIGVGCTGGRHRSVVVAEHLAATLAQAVPGVELQVQHRDLQRR
ncbi:MAG TPA: RNase adapter RapZ [bacterium]|nr:RNase adapter RapZ [bacterium]